MQKIIDELNSLKKGIDEAHSNKDKLEGREQEILRQMKEQFQVSSVEEAKEKMELLKKESDRIKTEIENGFKKLSEEFEW